MAGDCDMLTHHPHIATNPFQRMGFLVGCGPRSIGDIVNGFNRTHHGVRARQLKQCPLTGRDVSARTEKAGYGVLSRRIDTVGYVGYDEDTLQHIHTRVDGWIESLTTPLPQSSAMVGKQFSTSWRARMMLAAALVHHH